MPRIYRKMSENLFTLSIGQLYRYIYHIGVQVTKFGMFNTEFHFIVIIIILNVYFKFTCGSDD